MENKIGIDFIKKIRTNQSSKNSSDIPVILVTGITSIETVIEARDVGVSEIISKPFSPEQVLQKLDNAINKKREFIDVEEYIGPTRRRRKINKSE
jgi:two-component system chemotaxis response regulator CheY